MRKINISLQSRSNLARRAMIVSATASFVLLVTSPMRRYRLFRFTKVTMLLFYPCQPSYLLPNLRPVPAVPQSWGGLPYFCGEVFCPDCRVFHCDDDTFMTMQVFIKRSIPFLVFPNMLVDPFMAYDQAVMLINLIRDLFRTKFFQQFIINNLPIFLRYSWAGFSAPSNSFFVRLGRSIPTFAFIPLQFSTGGRAMNIQYFCNFGLRDTYFQKCINLVSLFLGKLVVTHIVPMSFGISVPLTVVGLKSLILHQLTFFLSPLLHLRVESKI